MRRHWSFIVCDPKYLYPLAVGLLIVGIVLAFVRSEPTMLNRFGNLIIGTGVWMSIRYTLREGLNRHKNHADNSPMIPGTTQLNAAYLNKITFGIGDALLQVHGFVLVIAGSLVGSFGDLALKMIAPRFFP